MLGSVEVHHTWEAGCNPPRLAGGVLVHNNLVSKWGCSRYVTVGDIMVRLVRASALSVGVWWFEFDLGRIIPTRPGLSQTLKMVWVASLLVSSSTFLKRMEHKQTAI